MALAVLPHGERARLPPRVAQLGASALVVAALQAREEPHLHERVFGRCSFEPGIRDAGNPVGGVCGQPSCSRGSRSSSWRTGVKQCRPT